MNRIYKVVWSKVKHAYVVVSELAPGYVHGTAGTGRYKTAMVALVACLCIGGSALAAPATNPPGEGPGIAIGTGSNAPKEENVPLGMWPSEVMLLLITMPVRVAVLPSAKMPRLII